jgi:hypothetical protein
MRSSIYRFCHCCLAIAGGLATLLASDNCLAVISYQLPNVQVAANPSGPTTGTFEVSVSAAPSDLPKAIGAFNLDFSVGGGNLVTLSSPQASAASLVPSVNPLLSDAGPVDNPYIVNLSPNAQTLRVGHDVPVDQPLMNGKNLVTVKFTVPAGTTGTFPLTFGPADNNVLVQGTATQLPLNLSDVGQISIMAAPAGVPGDYNNNGVVDAADYVVWRNQLGTSTTLQNEVAGVTPGSVTNEDYTAWRARFGRTSGAGAGAALGAAAVPEPTSWAAAALLVVSFLVGTRNAVRRAAARPALAWVPANGGGRRDSRPAWKCLDRRE